MRFDRYFLAGLLAIVVYVYFSVVSVQAAELIMFRAKSCYWCKVWDKEVGVIYNKTKEGKQLPIRMVDLSQRPDDLKHIKKVIYSPTFVLLENNKEVGRILGYPGEEFFWQELASLISRLTKSQARLNGH